MDFPFSRNGLIVTEPMESQQVKARIVDGFATTEQRTALTKLRVLVPYAGSPTLEPIGVGFCIWVRADRYTSAWAKAKYDVEGHASGAILVPESEVILFTRTAEGS